MPARDLHYSELIEVGQRIQKRELSSVNATQAQLDRIARLDGRLKSYAHVMADSALAAGAAAEKEIAAGKIKGPLHGVPIAVKDLCWTKGAPTAHGMTIHRDYPSDRGCHRRRTLKDAGAIILGKLQQTEGAYADHHPKIDPPQKSLERDALAGRVVERLRRRHRRRALFRLARNRHRRIDPLSVGRQRRHRSEADLGTGQPLRRVRTRGDAGSYRTDGAQRGGLRRNAGRDRRRRIPRIPTSVPLPVPDYLAGPAGQSAGRDDRRRSHAGPAKAPMTPQPRSSAKACGAAAELGAEDHRNHVPRPDGRDRRLVSAVRRRDGGGARGNLSLAQGRNMVPALAGLLDLGLRNPAPTIRRSCCGAKRSAARCGAVRVGRSHRRAGPGLRCADARQDGDARRRRRR